MDHHLGVNRANWDDRATLHADRGEQGYRVQRYVDDPALLSEVVRFDAERLGPVAGLRVVHLQCHIGTDTLSLARLGARVTGLDFSPNAIAEARRLVAETGDDVEFVVADVHAAASVLPAGGFDLVYTGIGALCWLPRIEDWARVVAELLAPGGSLFIREIHPVLAAIDSDDEGMQLRLPYFEREAPTEWDEEASYVDTSRPLSSTKTYQWNHGLGEVVSALLDAGLRIDLLVEHDSVPYPALPGRMVQRPGGEFALVAGGVAPLSYTIRATKTG